MQIDSGRYLGLTEEDAAALAKSENLKVRITARDKRHFLVTRDMRNDRINFWVEDGLIVRAMRG